MKRDRRNNLKYTSSLILIMPARVIESIIVLSLKSIFSLNIFDVFKNNNKIVMAMKIITIISESLKTIFDFFILIVFEVFRSGIFNRFSSPKKYIPMLPNKIFFNVDRILINIDFRSASMS